MAIGKPSKITSNQSSPPYTFDLNKNEPTKRTPTLTWRETKIIELISKYNSENKYATYEGISQKSNLSIGCIRSYMSGIVKKGVPIVKKKLKTGVVLFAIEDTESTNKGSGDK